MSRSYKRRKPLKHDRRGFESSSKVGRHKAHEKKMVKELRENKMLTAAPENKQLYFCGTPVDPGEPPVTLEGTIELAKDIQKQMKDIGL